MLLAVKPCCEGMHSCEKLWQHQLVAEHFKTVQGRMSQTCARLTALVLLANAMVAMYLFLGTGRGGTSWAGHFVKSIHGKSSSSSGMATTLWSRVDSSNFEPQVLPPGRHKLSQDAQHHWLAIHSQS